MGISDAFESVVAVFRGVKVYLKNDFEKLEQEGFYDMASPEVRQIVDDAKAKNHRVQLNKNGGVSVYRNEDTPARWVLNYDRKGNITNEIPRSLTIT